MKKRIKIISIIVVIVIMVAYSVYAYLQPMGVETKTMYVKDSEISFIESGVVKHSGEQNIFPLVPGQVVQILVEEGSVVEKGDILAELDSSAIDLQIEQLISTIDGFKAQLSGAEVEHQINMDTLEATKSNLIGQLQALNAQSGTKDQRDLEQLLEEQSKTLYDRGLEDLAKNKELLDLGIISLSEYQAFESLVDTYEANYAQSKIGTAAGTDYYDGMRRSINAQIGSINSTLEQDTLTTTKAYFQSMIEGTEASLKALKVQASYYNITASIAGVVNDIMIENVNLVTGMTPAFIIQGEGNSQVEVKVNTRDIEVVSEGDSVMLILDRRAGDVEMAGKISYIANSASVEISPLGLEERKVLVYIKPEDSSGIGAGYDVDVKFIVFSGGDKLVIPNSALYKVDEKDMIMTIRGGEATEVPVTLGYELTGETIIDEGLTEGDQVIIDLDAKGLTVGKKVISSNE